MANREDLLKYIESLRGEFERGLKEYQEDLAKFDIDPAAVKEALENVELEKRYSERLFGALGNQASINTRNRVKVLNFLFNSGYQHFLFIDFANLVNDIRDELNVKKFKEIVIKLSQSPMVPIHTFTRFNDYSIKYTEISQAVKGYIHPSLEMTHLFSDLSINTKDFSVIGIKNEKKLSFESEEAQEYFKNSINKFRDYLSSIYKKESLSPEDYYMLHNKYSTWKSLMHIGGMYYSKGNNEFVQSSFIECALLDFFRYVSIFDDKFALEKLEKCPWCSNFFVKSSNSQSYCSFDCSHQKNNQ